MRVHTANCYREKMHCFTKKRYDMCFTKKRYDMLRQGTWWSPASCLQCVASSVHTVTVDVHGDTSCTLYARLQHNGVFVLCTSSIICVNVVTARFLQAKCTLWHAACVWVVSNLSMQHTYYCATLEQCMHLLWLMQRCFSVLLLVLIAHDCAWLRWLRFWLNLAISCLSFYKAGNACVVPEKEVVAN